MYGGGKSELQIAFTCTAHASSLPQDHHDKTAAGELVAKEGEASHLSSSSSKATTSLHRTCKEEEDLVMRDSAPRAPLPTSHHHRTSLARPTSLPLEAFPEARLRPHGLARSSLFLSVALPMEFRTAGSRGSSECVLSFTLLPPLLDLELTSCDVLQTVGTVLSMRRPSPPFAFVEYGDAEAVLRCLEVVNGATLTGKSGQEKALLVKADEKTTARLDEYKTSRVKSEVSRRASFASLLPANLARTQSEDEYLLQAKDDLAAIIVRMNAGDLPSTSTLSNEQSSANSTSGGRSLAHLQDLDAQDLPEQHREIVTSEIALFRERAAKRAAEKAQMEAQMEARRNNGPVAQQSRGWGARGGASPSVDPQSYNQPIGFVGQGHGAGVKQGVAAEPVIDDAQRERERAEREHRQAQAMFEDVSFFPS
jgi:hypothetical protein